jgi:hypothetical protein
MESSNRFVNGQLVEDDLEPDSITADSISNPTPVIEKSWIPTAKQAVVLGIPDTVFEGLGGGSAGGGKTDLGLMIPLARQFTEHPKFKGLIMRRTLADLEKELIPRQQEWYAPSGGTYNETKKVWKFPSGAKIQNGMKSPTSPEHSIYTLRLQEYVVPVQTYRRLLDLLQILETSDMDSSKQDL